MLTKTLSQVASQVIYDLHYSGNHSDIWEPYQWLCIVCSWDFMLQVCVHTVTIANIITCVPSWEKCQCSTQRLLEITGDYWRLLEITG